MVKLLHIPGLLLLGLLLSPHGLAQSTAEEFYESALAYQADDDDAAAIIQLKNGLQQSPGHLPSRMLLGRLLLAVGDAESAEHQLQAALDLGGDHNLVMPNIGEAWLQQRAYDKVLDYRDYQEMNPRGRALWLDVRGKAYLALEDYEEAVTQFAQSLTLNPEQVDPLTGQGYALLLQKKSRQARELAQRAEALAPVDDSVLSLLGDIAMVEEQFAAALDYYDRALEANPNNFNARLRRVVLHMASNDLDAADADIDFVLNQFPDNPRALVAKAMLLIRQDRNPEAQRLLEEFNYRLSGITRKEMSANVNIQIIRAQTHYLQGAFAQALPLLRDINKAYPEKTFVRQMLTDTYYAGGRYDEIVNLYRPITILSRSDAKYVYIFARAAWRARRYPDAERKLQQWAEANPELFAELSHLLAATYHEEGRNDEALVTIAGIDAGDSTPPSGRLLLGKIQLEENDLPAARATADALVADYPQSVRALNFACIVMKRQGELDQAIDHCTRAINAAPQDPAPVINLGLIYTRQGRYEEAIQTFNAVLTVFPRNARALGGLAHIAEQQGELEIALRMTRKLAAYEPRESRHRLKLAEFYIANKEPAKALASIEYVESLQPLNKRGVVLRSQAYRLQEDWDRAGDQLRFLFGMSAGSDDDLLPWIAAQQLTINKLEDARKTIDRLARIPGYEQEAAELGAEYHYLAGDPGACVRDLSSLGSPGLDDRLLVLLSRCHVRDGNPQAAVRLFDRALTQAPDDGLAVQRFRVQLLLDRQLAIDSLQRYVKDHPNSPAAWRAIGDYFVQVDLARARQIYEQLLAEWPEHAPAEVNNNLANVLLLQGADIDSVLAYARTAYQLDPDNPSLADTYGWALARDGQFEAALNYLREAWARRSGSDEVNYHLAYTLAKLGRANEAREYAERIARRDALTEQQRALLADIERQRPI